jgi:hypothetical protein
LSVNVTTHPIIQAILDSQLALEDVAVLVGYFGPSPKTDFVRLYFSLEFQLYCELHSPQGGGGDILYTVSSNPGNPNSPTIVVLNAETLLKVVAISSAGVQASFLRGSISSANLGTAAASVAREDLIGQGCINYTVVIFTTRPVCQSHTPTC